MGDVGEGGKGKRRRGEAVEVRKAWDRAQRRG